MSGFCQACWDEAYLLAVVNECNGKGQGEIYNELVRSRPVTYHDKKCTKTPEVPAQELQTKDTLRPQTKRRTKGKPKWL